MTDNQFRQEFQRKIDAFSRLVLSTVKLEDDAQGRLARIEQAYQAFGDFLVNALGPDGEAQTSQGGTKSDGTGASSWSNIRPNTASNLTVGAERNMKGEGSAWAGSDL